MNRVTWYRFAEKAPVPVLLACITLFQEGCVVPFEAQTQVFENALVIESILTNEVKQHEIRLNRTFTFEADGPLPERNAEVRVIDDMGAEMLFREESPGMYLSESEFAALPGRSYRLVIISSDGRLYESESEQLTPEATIDGLFAERIINEDGAEGMAIRINSTGTTGNARNYRYDYEETFKIIAPKWTSKDLIPDPDERCGVLVVDRENEQRVCYGSQPSNIIVITNTNGLNADSVQDFMVRFIRRDNYILTHRYSILVRQLVVSDEAYTYYETLNAFSASESLFSETQPGFLLGNVFSPNDPGEKVLGYFEVASVTEKRIFFNYDDFFPGEPLPPYVHRCAERAPPIYGKVSGPIPEEFLRCVLKPLVALDSVRYVGENEKGIGEGGPYLVVPKVCGDCTTLGEAEVPEFWVE